MGTRRFNFGTGSEPDLDVVDGAIDRYLDPFFNNILISQLVERSNRIPLAEKQGKGYLAISTQDFKYARKKYNMYIVAFGPDSATGDENTHKRSEITSVAPGLPALEDLTPYHVPRDKLTQEGEPLPLEVVIPLFSSFKHKIYDTVNLWELGLKNVDGDVQLVKTHLIGRSSPQSPVEITVSYTRTGERYGDPHTIWSNPNDQVYSERIHVVGFVPIENSTSYLANSLDSIAKRPLIAD
jgi:hypothetical protein